MSNLLTTDNICAISTPGGVGGIAVIRVSGPDAISLCDKVWKGISLVKVASHTAHLGHIVAPGNPLPLDQAVSTVFRAPHSFTGEDVVEFSIHGGQWIQKAVLELLIKVGCRLAEPGEFTRRSVIAGQTSLTQAEATADLIAARSESYAKVARQQMRGDLKNKIASLRDQLLTMASLLELELDFSEEEVEFASRDRLLNIAQETYTLVHGLDATFSTGQAIKEGIKVAIVGQPNAGKSTLLNALLDRERAIVSNIPGTTRDTVEESIDINGLTFRFIDTAGLRETTDTIERFGVTRSLQALSEASIILCLITHDISTEEINELRENVSCHKSPDAKVLYILNKADLGKEVNCPDLTISATICAKNAEETSQKLYPLLESSFTYSPEDVIITNLRHHEQLSAAAGCLQQVITGLSTNLTSELVAQDLRQALFHLSSLTGEVTDNQILGNIFSHFCIGK